MQSIIADLFVILCFSTGLGAIIIIVHYLSDKYIPDEIVIKINGGKNDNMEKEIKDTDE